MPEAIRILFVGELHSSHAQGWIDLLSPLKDEFEIQGLHISSNAPPPEMNYPIFDVGDLGILDKRGFKFDLGGFKFEIGRKDSTRQDLVRATGYIHGFGAQNNLQLGNAKRILKTIRPHIVHTLGIFPASAFFLRVLYSSSDLGCKPIWIVQARGGPDIALNRKNPGLAPEIKAILGNCDFFIADNQQNYDLALDMGLAPEKLSMTGPVPGAGGIEPSTFGEVPLPSHKERLILWPKAYNCIQSDGMVVLEALRLALPYIGDFHLIATAAIPDVEYWFHDMLCIYGTRVEIHSRLPYEQLQKIYRTARVLLAPSLSDGVPNSMYEAMASHTVPILSPIETLLPLFVDKVHTIYAPNLNPSAIAKALVNAMNDDALADNIAMTNRAYLPVLAGRESVRGRVVAMYRQAIKARNLVSQGQKTK